MTGVRGHLLGAGPTGLELSKCSLFRFYDASTNQFRFSDGLVEIVRKSLISGDNS
jgi:hypothetical protein